MISLVLFLLYMIKFITLIRINIWAMKGKIFLKDGDLVCHVSNLKLVLSIDKVIYESREIICEAGTPRCYKKDDGQFYCRRSFIQGVQCKYLDKVSGQIHIIKELFHSNTLIPYAIVLQGEVAIQNFLIDLTKGITAFNKER